MARTASVLTSDEAIAVSYLAALSANRAVVTDASGYVVSSAVTDTELGYVSGVTSAIQTQLNAKASSTGYTASRVMISDGTGALVVSPDITTTELGYLNGATGTTGTGNLVFSASPIFTGTATFDRIDANTLRAVGSGGVTFEANNGDDVAIFGASGGQGATFYGGVNVTGVLNASSTVLMGASSARALIGITPKVQIEGTTYDTSSLSLTCNSATPTDYGILVFAKSRGATVGSVTALQNGDYLAGMHLGGADGTQVLNAGGLLAAVDGVVSTGDVPTRWEFWNRTLGAGSSTCKFVLSNAGALTLGSTSGTGTGALYAGAISVMNSGNVTIANANESTTLTDFTQSLTNAGVLINAEYTADAYTSGIFWATSNNNATKPKAGIFMQGTGTGTNLILGTSSDYATGIVSTVTVTTAGGLITSGKVRIGTTDATASQGSALVINSSLTTGSAGTGSLILQGAEGKERIKIYSAGGAGTGGPLISLFSFRGSIASPTATQSGDIIGGISGGGYGATGYSANCYGILQYANENWTDSAQGTYTAMQTIPNGSTSATVRFLIANDGSVTLGSAFATGTGALYASDVTLTSSRTTTNSLDITASALTTGYATRIYSNSADTSSRFLLFVHNDNSSATGTCPIRVVQDAVTSTNFKKIFDVSGGPTLWVSNGNTPNGALPGSAGDVCWGGDSGKSYYCTGTTNWTAM